MLAETGYQYDSSVFPIRFARYGFPEGPDGPAMQRGRSRELAEFPLPTLPIGPFRLPVLAGAYLRLLPVGVTLHALRFHVDRRLPLVVNVHPWELDPGQPNVVPRRLVAWAHYARVGLTERILRRVLSGVRFRGVATRLREIGLLEPPATHGRGTPP